MIATEAINTIAVKIISDKPVEEVRLLPSAMFVTSAEDDRTAEARFGRVRRFGALALPDGLMGSLLHPNSG